MIDGEESKYQGLAGWLGSRLEEWRNHRDSNYLDMWDEYYRLWRGIWTSLMEVVCRLGRYSNSLGAM